MKKVIIIAAIALCALMAFSCKNCSKKQAAAEVNCECCAADSCKCAADSCACCDSCKCAACDSCTVCEGCAE